MIEVSEILVIDEFLMWMPLGSVSTCLCREGLLFMFDVIRLIIQLQ